MTELFDKLNLRPQERRFVVGVFVVVVIILNYVFIWPYFSDWTKVSKDIESSKATITRYQEEIQRDKDKGGYEEMLNKLDKTGPMVQLKEGDVQLQTTVMRLAETCRISILNYTPSKLTTTSTNQSFFDEQSASISFAAEEKDLLDFLYAVGGDNSMIRVRELNLKPQDNNRYRLSCTVKLTATYAKKAPVAPAAGTGTNKPAVSKPTLVSASKISPTNAPAAGKKAGPQPPTPQNKK